MARIHPSSFYRPEPTLTGPTGSSDTITATGPTGTIDLNAVTGVTSVTNVTGVTNATNVTGVTVEEPPTFTQSFDSINDILVVVEEGEQKIDGAAPPEEKSSE